MTIVFISTYLNHHNKPLCDALYEYTNGDFWYIATSRISDWRKKMGFDGFKSEYLLDYTDKKEREKVFDIVNDADVVIIGASEPLSLIRKRQKQKKLTFRSSERLFKTSIRYLKAPIHWYRSLLSSDCYMLCCSANTARDYNLLGFYKSKCYKWGYFTEVDSINTSLIWGQKKEHSLKTQRISILWVGRLIRLKHPETAVKALNRVREAGISFNFNIIGDGPVAEELQQLIDSLKMNDCVHMLGARSTNEVREYMRISEIFLFTSNREEGWGAVLNESMSSACAVIANSEIGSVPFLIQDGVNGLVYEKGSIDELTTCLMKLMKSYPLRSQLGEAAYCTISRSWSPRVAARRLLQLINSLQKGEENPFKSGPCSPA